ncbi:MAG: M20 family metallopeptidase, partial [Desulfobacteraceae bacterium]
MAPTYRFTSITVLKTDNGVGRYSAGSKREMEGAAVDSGRLKREVCQVVDALTELLMGLSTEIHRTPELSFEEHKAVQLITAALRDGGFEIEKGIAGLETAFRATHPSRSNGPRIAFLAEYDALPGVGHACGHNIIAGSAVGAALAVGKIKERLPGTLQILGCPAEEKGGGKVIMVEKGVFGGVDIAMMAHPETKNSGTRKNLTLVPLEITFEGKSAHASAAPEQGINALNALIQTFNSIHALREHLTSDASIHGIITKGGERTNIVPDLAQCRFSVRSPRRTHRDELVEKLKNCARGAALAMGCKVRFDHFDQIYDSMRTNEPLERAFLDNLESLGIDVTRDVEQERGSTDAANVSQVVPILHAHVAIAPEGIKPHTEEFAQAASSE